MVHLNKQPSMSKEQKRQGLRRLVLSLSLTLPSLGESFPPPTLNLSFPT